MAEFLKDSFRCQHHGIISDVVVFDRASRQYKTSFVFRGQTYQVCAKALKDIPSTMEMLLGDAAIAYDETYEVR